MGILGKRLRRYNGSGLKIFLVVMWHRFKNLCFSLNTYKTLSPDLGVRYQVNQGLGDRPMLSSDQWFETFYQSQNIAPAVAGFAYHYLGTYSGLEMGRVQPTDRLHPDLHWAEVCWFDWETQFCADVQQQFSVDISDCLDDCQAFTIGELVAFLDQVTRGVPEPFHFAES